MLAALRSCSRRTPISAAPARVLQTRYSSQSHGAETVFDILDNLNITPTDAPPRPDPRGYAVPQTQMPKPGSWDASLKLRLHCNASPNNTIATLTKENGSTIAWFSGGSCGFKKANRASYEAGYQCAVRLFKKIEDLHRAQGPVSVQLYFKGFGQGRDALKAALLATEGESIRPLVESVTDRTPIKIGGTRAKKMPRL